MPTRLLLLAALALLTGCYTQAPLNEGGGGGPTPTPSPTATPFYGPSTDTVFPIGQ
jgi:hypothetical protein